MPTLAMAFCMRFAAEEVVGLYDQLMQDIKHEDFKNLELMHHYASGFKAFFTYEAHNRLEVLRQSLGGVGFADFAGINEMLREDTPGVTFEGDTTIMLQQGARFLMKNVKAIGRGSKANGFMAYLNDLKNVDKKQTLAKSKEDFLNVEVLEDALATRAALMVGATMELMAKQKARGKNAL